MFTLLYFTSVTNRNRSDEIKMFSSYRTASFGLNKNIRQPHSDHITFCLRSRAFQTMLLATLTRWLAVPLVWFPSVTILVNALCGQLFSIVVLADSCFDACCPEADYGGTYRFYGNPNWYLDPPNSEGPGTHATPHDHALRCHSDYSCCSV